MLPGTMFHNHTAAVAAGGGEALAHSQQGFLAVDTKAMGWAGGSEGLFYSGDARLLTVQIVGVVVIIGWYVM